MKRAVFFDVGDTLILANPKVWLEPFLKDHNLTVEWSRLGEAARTAFKGYSAHHMEAKDLDSALALWHTFDRTLLAGLGVPEADQVADELISSMWDTPSIWPLVPHAREVIKTLQERGYHLAIVSNWDGVLPHVLKVLDLADRFESLAISSLVGAAKPSPVIFEKALNDLGVSPQEVLHVGDSPDNDIAAAEALGIEGALFDPYGRNPKAMHDLREVIERVEGQA